ncbi:MAG: 50S ribosomal protein L15 [Candidatus Marinimicrobia bacterium]|nr:50S ribosomal protein L15 [Candidatus Neomarinimicrobiota bacterium]
MELGNIKPAEGSVRGTKRIGRGNASGQGRTAGRGSNGYHARSGSKAKLYFEGGQMPLMRRLPKRGFKNYPFRIDVQIVNLDQLSNLKVESIDVNGMIEKGLIKKAGLPVKVLGGGDITSAMEICADMFSKSAIDKIEKAGGKAIFS